MAISNRASSIVSELGILRAALTSAKVVYPFVIGMMVLFYPLKSIPSKD